MMTWKTETEPQTQPRRTSTMMAGNSCNGARLIVIDGDDKQVLHLTLSLVDFSPESHDTCRREWPKVAIPIARAWLDELEKQLEEQTDEPE